MTSAEKADMSSANNTAGVYKHHAAASVNADGAATGMNPDDAATGMNPDGTATGINPDDAVIGTTTAACTTRHFHCTTCPSECALTIETRIDENGVEHVPLSRATVAQEGVSLPSKKLSDPCVSSRRPS